MVILSKITEKECVIKERYANSKANIRFLQDCTAISATAELLFEDCVGHGV